MVVDKRNPVLQHLSLEELQLRGFRRIFNEEFEGEAPHSFWYNNIIMYSKLHRPLKQSSVNTQVKDVVGIISHNWNYFIIIII